METAAVNQLSKADAQRIALFTELITKTAQLDEVRKALLQVYLNFTKVIFKNGEQGLAQTSASQLYYLGEIIEILDGGYYGLQVERLIKPGVHITKPVSDCVNLFANQLTKGCAPYMLKALYQVYVCYSRFLIIGAENGQGTFLDCNTDNGLYYLSQIIEILGFDILGD